MSDPDGGGEVFGSSGGPSVADGSATSGMLPPAKSVCTHNPPASSMANRE